MHKKQKKVFCLITAATLAFTMLLTGCGSSGANSGDAGKEVTVQQDAASTQSTDSKNLIGQNVKFDPDKKMSGKLNVWFYEDGKKFIDPLFQDYKKYRSGVDLQVTYIPWGDYWKKLPVAISSGNGPDLYYFHNMYHNLMVDGGLMEPYTQELVDNLKKDYKNIDQFDINGKTYYVGVGGGHGIIYYNKDMWSAAGLSDTDFPKTWEKLREVAIKLTKTEGEKIKVAGFNYNPSAGAFINDWQFLSGRFLFSEDGKKILIDNNEFKKTFKFFVDLYKVDKVCTPTYPDAMQSFMDGTTAMLWMHPFFNGVIKAQKPDLKFGVFAMPKFNDIASNYHYNNPDVSMGVNSKIAKEKKALAFDLLNLYFADDKYMEAWDLAQGLAPTKISLEKDETLTSDPVLKVIMSDFDNSLYVGPAPDQMTQDLIQNMIDPVLKANVDIDSAVKAAVAKVDQTLSGFNFLPVERKWSRGKELK